MWYPNKPSYELKETFRYKAANVRARRASDDSNSNSNDARFNQHQWSLQQYLRNEVTSTSYKTYFGQYVAISGDSMTIGARGFTGSQPLVSLFTRPRQGGFWSQQQILLHPEEAKIRITAALVYNSVFSTHGTGDDTAGNSFVQYQSEMAHGKWTCLLVSMFDEFGDGWDTAKLRVSYSDGTYDYYYPDCNSPNPLEFEYCPSMHQQGGTYTFEIVHHEEARFNWEIEWMVQMNLAPHKALWGNSSDVFVATRHSRMSFYWNPLTLSFEKLETAHLIKNTVSCGDCPDKDEDAVQHRNLLAVGTEEEKEGEVERAEGGGTHRTLNHAAHTASPTVSPAPTLVQEDGYLADWEKLVMTTSNVNQPWFKTDRSGTYFMLSDLEGKKLIRKDAQCGGGLTPLTHSCWLNYPEAIPDGEYIARIGGARAGPADTLHSWSFCGVSGGQLEHLQFKVQHGQCYPVQRFTKTRFCSFKEGTGVLLEMTIDLGLFDGPELTNNLQKSIFTAYANLLPNTKSKDFSITGQRRDDNGHLHVTVGLRLKLEDHGFDPSDFSAVSRLESEYNSLMFDAASSGTLASALASSFEGTGAFLEQSSVHVEHMHFETATTPRGPIEVDDDAPRSATAEDVVDKDWLLDYQPASPRQVQMYALLADLSDVVAVCGYIGLLVCAVYGAKAVHQKYKHHAPRLERDLEAASSVVQQATQRASTRSQTRFSTLQKKVLGLLDEFSDYVVDGEVTRDVQTGEPLIAEVVIPSLDKLLSSRDEEAARGHRGHRDSKEMRKGKSKKKSSEPKRSMHISNREEVVSVAGDSRWWQQEQQQQQPASSSSSEEQDEASVSVYSYESSGSSSGSGSGSGSGSDSAGSTSSSSSSSAYSSSSSEQPSSSDQREEDEEDDECYVMQSFKR